MVDEIVGEGGVEVPGCVVTKYELIQIVKHWAAEIVDQDFSYFLDGCTGSSEWRIREYANRRLNTIAKSIGDAEVTKAFRQVEDDFGKKVDARAWKIFKEGTQEERESFQHEAEEKLADNLVGASDEHKPPEHTRDPYSQQTLQRAYQMFEQGSTHVAVMNETGLDRETAEWISDRQLAGLGLPPIEPVTIVDSKPGDDL